MNLVQNTNIIAQSKSFQQLNAREKYVDADLFCGNPQFWVISWARICQCSFGYVSPLFSFRIDIWGKLFKYETVTGETLMMLKPDARRAISNKRKSFLLSFSSSTISSNKATKKEHQAKTPQYSSTNQYPVWLTAWNLGSIARNWNPVFGVHTFAHL